MTATSNVRPLVALVVDDHESSRYVIRSWFDRAGFRVVPAATGAEALRALADESVDVAIVDVNLPDMSGFEICEAIRSNPSTEWMPVVHVSATAVEASDRSEGLLRGADAYLTEPVEPRELLAIVGSLLRRAHVRQEALKTAARLRALNTTSADVHAASHEERIFVSVVNGASTIADGPALLLARHGTRYSLWSQPEGPRRLSGEAAAAARCIMDTAAAGHTTVTASSANLVATPHIGVPFNDESGEPAGAILIPAQYDDANGEVLPMLAQLALTTTLSLANLRALDVEHRIALTLQQSLLPQQDPDARGLTFAFRYVAASRHAQVGGDFYEAFALDADRAVIAIGDVVGHSLHAAIIMGKIRHALRAYAIDGYDPAEVLDRLDRMIRRFHPADLTTAICGVVDVAHGELRFCNAGHLPFVRITGGRAELVDSHITLLGLGPLRPTTTTVPIAPGDRIILFTDGLIERRHESIDTGLERVRATSLALAEIPIDKAIDELLQQVGPGEGQEDDIAILAFDVEPDTIASPGDPHVGITGPS